VLHRLGIQPEDRIKIVNEVNIILNSAASVNFMEPLRDALQSNYFGALRLLDLAHECKHLISMVHVSSSYVNVNQKPFTTIPEKLMDLKVDPEQYINQLVAMNPQTLEQETQSILDQFGFPNTYTFSKHMAEQVIGRKRGNLRIAIVRPSSIFATHQQPFPGWTDSIGTIGSVLMPMGLGLANTFVFRPKPNWQTFVPVDLCCNAMIVTAMVAAKSTEPKLSIYHCTTSARAKRDVYPYLEDCANYLKYHPYDSAISENIGFNVVHNLADWHKQRAKNYDLPAKAMMLASKLPFVGLGHLKKQSQAITSVADKMQKIEEGYYFFR
jgi:alcohol-forming fatty acyl-CoA reductase